jgi:hypothetical protein
MTQLLRRALRRLDHHTATAFHAFAPLSDRYRAVARRSPRG